MRVRARVRARARARARVRARHRMGLQSASHAVAALSHRVAASAITAGRDGHQGVFTRGAN